MGENYPQLANPALHPGLRRRIPAIFTACGRL
jgi:hypothetical protein